jgi:hypothetical protein
MDEKLCARDGTIGRAFASTIRQLARANGKPSKTAN